MAPIKLQILSDLHLETPASYDLFEINAQAPYLALLGDIGYVRDAGFFYFLRKQLEKFSVVFLVLGNHEPYHSSWAQTVSTVERFQKEIIEDESNGSGSHGHGRLVLLNRTRFDISPTVTVLGCTLFSHVSDAQAESVSFGLNDFYNIADWTVEQHQEAHHADLAWLNAEVEAIARWEPARRVVVFTHHCPLMDDERVVDPKHRQSKISSGFMSELSGECCWRSEVVRLWAFGHTHYNCDFNDDDDDKDANTGKRVVANQRGYYFAQSEGFDGLKVVEI